MIKSSKIAPYAPPIQASKPSEDIEATNDDRTANPEVRQFESNREKIVTTPMPDSYPDASMKSRISTLEDCIATQQQINALTGETFANLDADLTTKEDYLRTYIQQVQEHFTNEMFAMKTNYDHRCLYAGIYIII